MNKGGVSKTLIAVSIFFILYLTSTILQSPFWGNILSPLGALLSAAIIFRVVAASTKFDFQRYIWISFGLACLFWAAADILWAVDEMILARDPQENLLGVGLYFLTNIFLFTGLFIFTVKSIRRWNALQLYVDAISIAVSILLLVWIMLLDKDAGNFGIVFQNELISSLSLILDIALFTGIAVWYISLRSGRISPLTRIIIGSLLAFSLSDIIYYFLYFKGLYIPNSILDAAYMASLLGLAVGVNLVPSSYQASDIVPFEGDNIGYNRKGMLLLPTPFIIFLFEGFNIPDLFVSGLVITSHGSISHFIQSSILRENMLKREKAINYELEKRIDDRTRELIEKNARLDFLSNQDTVTSLYNRRFFLVEMEKRVAELAKDETIALAFIDLDRFKTINDAYGHYIGDHILIEIAKRLKTYENADILIARLGGDEFVITRSGKFSLKDAEELMSEVVAKCSEPICLGELTFDVTLSVGISMYPIDAESTDALLRNADMAMYEAKKLGFNKIVVFNSLLKLKNRQKNKIEINLKKADFEREFSLFYQPQFSLPDRNLIGIEALIRWNCPGKGYVEPTEFIPIAEEINWIIPIGDWVMNHAIHQISQWNREYDSNLKMAVNVSPKQLDQPDFAKQILSVLALEGVPVEWIDIEITEGVALEGAHKINRFSEHFKETGITVSIDDFGTGYSSLSYLKLFPFHRVKIARQLIDNITFDRYDLQIVRSILLLTSAIGVTCIAEGVESKEQYDLLCALDCPQVQGFFLGRPLPAAEFEKTFLNPSKKAGYFH